MVLKLKYEIYRRSEFNRYTIRCESIEYRKGIGLNRRFQFGCFHDDISNKRMYKWY